MLTKRIVIIGDNTVEYRLLTEIRNLGTTDCTCYAFHGQARRAKRPRRAEPGNTKIELIALPDVAQKILEHLALHYFDNYAMIAFIDDVEVLRGDKFVASPARTMKASRFHFLPTIWRSLSSHLALYFITLLHTLPDDFAYKARLG